jgi:hypothetical protein
MKANELRIGSLVYITDTSTLLFYKQVTQINIHNLMYLCGETKDPFEFEIEPIPLTEEWLLKFGAKKESYTYFIRMPYELDEHGIKFQITLRKGIFIYYGSIGQFIKIQYVHQLQNLYFALTNEELR